MGVLRARVRAPRDPGRPGSTILPRSYVYACSNGIVRGEKRAVEVGPIHQRRELRRGRRQHRAFHHAPQHDLHTQRARRVDHLDRAADAAGLHQLHVYAVDAADQRGRDRAASFASSSATIGIRCGPGRNAAPPGLPAGMGCSQNSMSKRSSSFSRRTACSGFQPSLASMRMVPV